MLLSLPFSNRAVITPKWLPEIGPTRQVFITPGGMGDSVMFSAVSENYNRIKREKLFVSTLYPEVFQNNPTVTTVSPRFRKLLLKNRQWEADLLRRRIKPISAKYFTMVFNEDKRIRQLFPEGYLVSRLCQRVGLAGKISLIPKIYFKKNEKKFGSFFTSNQVAVQSKAKTPSKDWGHKKMQMIITALRDQLNFIQIGVRSDPLLEGALDLRGLPLRATAAVLYHSVLFCGMVGGLMHLARAVGCRSVVAWPGNEPEDKVGYRGNIHVKSKYECRMCAENQLSIFSGDKCPAEYRCITEIPLEGFIYAIRESFKDGKLDMEDETVTIAADPAQDCLELYHWKAMVDGHRRRTECE